MRKLFTSVLLATLVSAPLCAMAESDKSSLKAKQAIVQLIGKTYDQPQAKVRTAPIVLAGEYAVAGWLQGEKGGRALLKKQADEWQIVLCAGDGLRQEQGLIAAGVAPALAKQLVEQVQNAESRLPATTLAKFASFDAHMKHVAHGHQNGHQNGHVSHAPAAQSKPATHSH